MRKWTLISVIFAIILSLSVVFFYWPPFPGVGSLGTGNLSQNRCESVEKELGGLSASNGYIMGRLTKVVYKKDRIFILIESLDGKKYSFMIVPREMGDSLAQDYYRLNFLLFKLKNYSLSYCGQPNMFSTDFVEGETRVDNSYEQIRDLVERYKNSGSVIAALVVNEQNNFVFDRSGVIQLHKLVYLPVKP